MTKNEILVNAGKSPFLQKHSAAIRIWHWLTFLIISFLILTVLFQSTLFNPGKNSIMIQNVLKEKSVVVTEDQARAVAHEYSDKLWDLHKFLGFGLSFLLLARIIIEFILSQEEKLRTKIKNALLLYRRDTRIRESKHYLLVKSGYPLFYLLVLYMATTGLLLAFGFQLGVPREARHLIKEFHGFGQYLMYTFVVVHLCGVILADIKHSKGIISGMVNGGE